MICLWLEWPLADRLSSAGGVACAVGENTMQKTDNNVGVLAIATREWQQLIDTTCRDKQVSTARVARVEGMLRMALELGAVDMALLLRWGEQAAQRLAAAIPNPLWPDSVIRVEDGGSVQITVLHQRAPVYRSTRD